MSKTIPRVKKNFAKNYEICSLKSFLRVSFHCEKPNGEYTIKWKKKVSPYLFQKSAWAFWVEVTKSINFIGNDTYSFWKIWIKENPLRWSRVESIRWEKIQNWDKTHCQDSFSHPEKRIFSIEICIPISPLFDLTLSPACPSLSLPTIFHQLICWWFDTYRM